jgi:chemotaxis methyl-accepting protein methylase
MDSLKALLEQIRQDRGLDLGSYKPSFLQRRLAVRLRARGCPDYGAYRNLLRRDPEEYGPLLDTLSINLSRFFRDGATFQALEARFLPELIQTCAARQRLRAWSAGCSAGEEPYSLALLLREVLGPEWPHWRVEILASDIDEKALARARAGRYPPTSFQGIDARYQPWIERYFVPGPQHELAAGIRALVSFHELDLTRDAVPANLDLILCRNVLIYFDREQQERLYCSFHQALRADGLLVLGKTEMLPMSWSQQFLPVDLREHIYRKRPKEGLP